MKTLTQVDLKDKKVLLRADYNVAMEDGKIVENERIKASIPTLKAILAGQPKFLLVMSHLGKPDGKKDERLSLQPVAAEVETLFGVKVELLNNFDDLVNITKSANSQTIYLLENIRFWPGEEAGDDQFAQMIADNFDIYINDAFSASHRDHASISKMPKYTAEKCAGLLLQEEFDQLSRVKDHPDQPAVAIIGGAKIETKLPVINNLMKIYDKVLVGGMIANEAIDQKLKLGEKVLLPTDFGPIGLEDKRLDLGPETIAAYCSVIKDANTIVWNGPLGKFEDAGCDASTKSVLKAVAENQSAHTVIGGGETLEAIDKFGQMSDFDYVSMSGGAMLEFMAGDKLPGIEALN